MEAMSLSNDLCVLIMCRLTRTNIFYEWLAVPYSSQEPFTGVQDEYTIQNLDKCNLISEYTLSNYK